MTNDPHFEIERGSRRQRVPYRIVNPAGLIAKDTAT